MRHRSLSTAALPLQLCHCSCATAIPHSDRYCVLLCRYAEDKRFFPDSLPPTLGAIDELWSSYSGHLGDTTFWGPRDRLRCFNKTAPLPPQAPTQQQLPATAPTRPRNKPPGRRERNNNQNGRTLIAPSAALGCMEMIRGSLGARSKLFVAVDAPRLQETIFR